MIVNNSDELKAEIIWALKSVYSGYSYNSSKDMSSLFHTMFPDSKIAKDMTIDADKIRYVINFGIAPIFKSMLVESIKLSECYVVCFDKSLNSETQNYEMDDILIRFFDAKDNKVKTCYLDSQYLGHSTHSDLIRGYNETAKDLDENKLVQISMDGPNFSLKMLQKINEERTANEFHHLISIGSCGLHTIHGTFCTGAEATDWSIKKVLRGVYIVLHDSPARGENYQEITGSDTFPLNFCTTWYLYLSIIYIYIYIYIYIFI